MVRIEYNGRKFKSIREFCEVFRLDYKLTMLRLQRKWSITDCIIGRKKHPNYAVTDHKGNRFTSVIAMCRFYNVDFDKFCELRRKNKKLAEILQ